MCTLLGHISNVRWVIFRLQLKQCHIYRYTDSCSCRRAYFIGGRNGISCEGMICCIMCIFSVVTAAVARSHYGCLPYIYQYMQQPRHQGHDDRSAVYSMFRHHAIGENRFTCSQRIRHCLSSNGGIWITLASVTWWLWPYICASVYRDSWSFRTSKHIIWSTHISHCCWLLLGNGTTPYRLAAFRSWHARQYPDIWAV